LIILMSYGPNAAPSHVDLKGYSSQSFPGGLGRLAGQATAVLRSCATGSVVRVSGRSALVSCVVNSSSVRL